MEYKMATDKLFLILAMVCLHGTATSLKVSTTTPEPLLCDYNDNYYQPNTTFEVDTCREGYCDSEGHVTLKDSCCEYNGVPYPLNSDTYIDDCNYITCGSGDGEGTHTVIDCAYPNCPGAIYTKGQCCPTCPYGNKDYCTYNGKMYPIGSNITSDGCNYQYCDEYGNFVPSYPCCTYNGSLYQHDTSLQIDPCTEIVFDDSCQTTTQYSCCLYDGEQHAHDAPVQIDPCTEIVFDDSCQTTTQYSCCLYDGEQHALGSRFEYNPCYPMFCDYDGSLDMGSISCDYSDCPNPVYLTDECCPVCEPTTTTTTPTLER